MFESCVDGLEKKMIECDSSWIFHLERGSMRAHLSVKHVQLFPEKNVPLLRSGVRSLLV